VRISFTSDDSVTDDTLFGSSNKHSLKLSSLILWAVKFQQFLKLLYLRLSVHVVVDEEGLQVLFIKQLEEGLFLLGLILYHIHNHFAFGLLVFHELLSLVLRL
jgi:hypothetical protein